MFSLLSITQLTAIIILTLLFLWWFYYQQRFKYWKKRRLPTTETYCFPVGDLSTAALGLESIHIRMQNLYNLFRKRGNIHAGIYFFNGPVYFPVEPQLIKQILVKDFEYFTDRGVYLNEEKLPLSSHLFTMQGNQWRHSRQKITPAFSSAKIKQMFPIVQRTCKNLVEILKSCEGADINVREKMTRYTMDVIGSCAFGIDCNTLYDPDGEFVQMVDKIMKHSSWELFLLAVQEGLQNPGNINKIVHSNKTMSSYFTNVVKNTIESRDKHNIVREDLLNMLMQMREDMSFREIAAQSFLFFAAGFETSSATLSFCLHELAYDQDIQDKLRKEIQDKLGADSSQYSFEGISSLPYLDSVLKETLRKYPAVAILNRICVKDYHVPGTDVKVDAGTPVLISVLGLQKHPDFFPDPERFDPDRFNGKQEITPFTYLPFGEGPRICIGLRLGLMEAKLALVTLLMHFRFYPTDTSTKNLAIEVSTTSIVLYCNRISLRIVSI